MKKPIIAVDIDDVLAAEAAFVVAYSNQHWRHQLTVDDYREFWGAMWGVDHEEAERRSLELHEPGINKSYEPLAGAREALAELSERFELVIVTSRREMVRQETLDWLDKHMGKVFSQKIFAGIWDDAHPAAHKRTKAEILQAIGARYLIDDQPKHCIAAADLGLAALLFGGYPWNRDAVVPAGVKRCGNWLAVLEYFRGIS
ncbi:MAG TPA: hypothetical protein VLE99_06350 [Candidatus Saccharimonadales bacterium]|nr:hypothetical protein [Candidatus Saccharimonadales bacterium]